MSLRKSITFFLIYFHYFTKFKCGHCMYNLILSFYLIWTWLYLTHTRSQKFHQKLNRSTTTSSMVSREWCLTPLLQWCRVACAMINSSKKVGRRPMSRRYEIFLHEKKKLWQKCEQQQLSHMILIFAPRNCVYWFSLFLKTSFILSDYHDKWWSHNNLDVWLLCKIVPN